MTIERIRQPGYVRLYKTPSDCGEDEFKLWWPRLTTKDKARYTELFKVPKFDRHHDFTGEWIEVEQTKNLFTTAGVTSWLNFWCFGLTSQIHAFGQVMSVGNGAIIGVTRADTAVAGDAFASGARKVFTSQSNSGFQGTHSTLFANADAVGTWTNGGAYGYDYGGAADATTTAGTGQLNTHFLISYPKNNSTSITLDYITVFSN